MFMTIRLVAIASAFILAAEGQQKCLKAAWSAMDAKQYALAITAAQECIDDFEPRAQEDQAELKAHEPLPPIGAVKAAADRNKILGHWSVNDVAAAHWIVGRASEALFKKELSQRYKDTALQAYTAAAQLSYGRVWDPQTDDCCFWSPAADATARIKLLKDAQAISQKRAHP